MQVALLEGKASAAASQAGQAQDQLADHEREAAAQQGVLQAEREAHMAEKGQLQQRLQDAVELQEQHQEAHSAAVTELQDRHDSELQAQADRLTSQHQSLLDKHSAQLRQAHVRELEGAQAAAVHLEQLLGSERQKSLNLKVGGVAWAAAVGGRRGCGSVSSPAHSSLILEQLLGAETSTSRWTSRPRLLLIAAGGAMQLCQKASSVACQHSHSGI